jgi:hypothetical protein
MPKLSLPWPIDRDGYHIKPARSAGTTEHANTIIESSEDAETWIVRNGGEDYEGDRLKVDGLYRRLAGCRSTEKGALDFVRRFGFLKGECTESVNFICEKIKVFRHLISLKQSQKWESLRHWMKHESEFIRLNPELLAGDPPEVFFRPSTLLDAIYLQFFEDLSSGANLRLCKRPGCREWFKYGPGTLHRNTAQYCSPKCQNAHKYAKRKEGAQ